MESLEEWRRLGWEGRDSEGGEALRGRDGGMEGWRRLGGGKEGGRGGREGGEGREEGREGGREG